MKLFLSYIKSHWKPIALSTLFAVILIVSFALYRLPLSAVMYPMLLCLLFAMVFIAIDFSREKKKHELMCDIKSIGETMTELLPQSESLIESDYQELIGALCREIGELQAGDAASYREMIDYYTVWVHQIKTPIASMKLSLQCEDSALSRKLSSELFRIEQYVAMVLAFLRLGSDHSDYVFREHNVDTIMRREVKKFAPEFIGRKIGLQLDDINKQIMTDEKWLAFVFGQLLSNALKYTREGSISIYLRGETLCIEDTGIGISPEDLPRIFDKGYTGANGRQELSSSGLGLYLCKNICQNLGIGISASSVPGKGTVIALDLSQYELKKE